MRRADNHSHIIHASLEEMVAAARARNLDRYSITEHVSQFAELRKSIKFGSVHTSGRMFDGLVEYIEEFNRIDSKALGRVKLNRGLEVDFSPRFMDKVGEFVNKADWDILLCSVHEFEDGGDIERRPRDPSQDERDRWQAYVHLQMMALESSFVPFNILAHPVRMSKASGTVPEDIDELLCGLAETAKRNNRALELNGNDIDYNLPLVRKLALACSRAHCQVSLGSDAHYPRDVFRNINLAMSMVDEFNLGLV